MSMNLYFTTVSGAHYVDFPYQTSTEVTFNVLDKPTNKERLALLKVDIESFDGGDELYSSCKNMIEDPTLQLDYM